MGMGFQTGSEMGMKFEVIGSWKRKNVTRMGANVSINCTSAQSCGHRADVVGATPIQDCIAAYAVASVTRRVLNVLATHAVTVPACPAECRMMYELAVHRAGTAAG